MLTDEAMEILEQSLPSLSARKARLLACAIFQRFASPYTRRYDDGDGAWEAAALRVALRLADGDATLEDLRRVDDPDGRNPMGGCNWSWHLKEDAVAAARSTASAFCRDAYGDTIDGRPEMVLELLHEVMGPPGRSAEFRPEWRSDTARRIAEHAYCVGDFAALPILADALQDAGCDAGELLDHCRGPSPHVRGCWAVDLVLGKE